MRLAASNLAWPETGAAGAWRLLRRHGVSGIEVAPTRIWPGWQGATPAAARHVAQAMQAEGFSIPALQSVLFGLPELAFFRTRAACLGLRDHLLGVADLAAALGAGVVVLGAPGARKLCGHSHRSAVEAAVPVLAELGQAFHDRGAVLCIEPNPPQYGCEFVITPEQGIELVEQVGSPGFGLHLDVAGIRLAGGQPPQAVRQLAGRFCHLHASEPCLAPLLPGEAAQHGLTGQALAGSGYAGWVSLEMREQPDDLASLDQALAVLAASYGEPR